MMKTVFASVTLMSMLFLLGFAFSCATGEVDEGGSDSDSDSDSDTDSDSDSDSDTDSDTDVDTDTNPCTDDCPDGSGFPCPCPLVTCDDNPDSICGSLNITSADVGVCASPCVTDTDCTTTLTCDAIPKCTLVLEGDTDTDLDHYCGYVCTEDGDCPAGMMCAQVADSTLYICYPEQT